MRSGIYYWRRRLPGERRGAEVAVSLRTRCYREAEHLASVADQAFEEAMMQTVEPKFSALAALRAVEAEFREGARRWKARKARQAARGRAGKAATTEPPWEWIVEQAMLAASEGHPPPTRAAVVPPEPTWEDIAALSREMIADDPEPTWEAEAEEITTSTEEVTADDPEPTWEAEAEEITAPTEEVIVSAQPTRETAPAPAKPLASSLMKPFFVRRKTVDGQTHQVMGQDGGTIRRFIETRGDKPLDEYHRGDIVAFLDTLRRLPRSYGKSPRDKDRTLAEIIAEANAKKVKRRLSDKTVKRHASALSQFFLFGVDRDPPLLTATRHANLFAKHRFRRAKGARRQRDPWLTEEIIRLLASPVWTGSQRVHRSRPGPHVIRDAKFWIPLLGLYHGGRLEEFADLYRRDVGRDGGGTWFLDIREFEREDGHLRRIKRDSATRRVPLHPELVRLGFLDYVAKVAPAPNSPLFPDLEPQGPDGKRGPRFTRWFVEYRKAIGLYREGVAMHSFRHNAITRLREVAHGERERHVDFMMGHERGGGEGRGRYDKGPQFLASAAETLAMLRYPEIDLSRLYDWKPGRR